MKKALLYLSECARGALIVALLPVAAQAQTTTPTQAPPVQPADQTVAGQAATEPSSAAPASPQAAPAGALGDIIVTARRREESAQSVPVSISVASGAELKTLNVAQTSQLTLVAPSLSLAPSIGGSSTITASIRGQRNNQPRLAYDASIGLYFADVPVARPYGLNAGIYDLQNVQVLNGPQGTLFGRNTTGGAIIFQPATPTDKVEGSVEGEYGNYNNRVLTGVLNLPVSDTLSVRVAGRIARRDGYSRNIIDGRDYDDVHEESGRASILYKPTSGVSNLLVADYFHTNTHGQLNVLKSVIPAAQGGVAAQLYSSGPPTFGAFGDVTTAAAAQASRSSYDGSINSPQANRAEVYGVSNKSEIQLSDNLSLKNIFGYRHTSVDVSFDLDGTALPIVNVVGGTVRADQFSEELQLEGNTASKSLEYIVGTFLFRETGTDILPSNALPGLSPAGITRSGGYIRNKSEAVFGQASYHFPGVEGLTLTAGARYSFDQRYANISPTDNFGCVLDRAPTPGAVGTCPGIATKNFSALTGTLGLDYKIGKTLLYVTSRRGYRSGGLDFQARSIATLQAGFRPEKVTDVEAGIKRDWQIGTTTLRTNVDGYYTWATDLQRSVRITPGDPNSTEINAANGHIYGFEGQLTYQLTPQFSINGSAVYTHARYVQFRDPVGGVYDDDRFAFSPEFRYTLGASYARELVGIGDLKANVNYQHASSYYWDDINIPDAFTQPVGLLGASLDLDRIAGTGIGATLFVSNATNKRYFAGGNGNLVGLNVGINAEPRMYGGRIRVAF